MRIPCLRGAQWSTVQLLSEMSRHKWGITHAELGDLPFHAHGPHSGPTNDGDTAASGPLEALPADFGGEPGGGASPSALWEICWRDRDPACSPPPPTRGEVDESSRSNPGAVGSPGDAEGDRSPAEEEGGSDGDVDAAGGDEFSERERAFLAERRAAVEEPGPEGDPMLQALIARVDALVAQRQEAARRFVPHGAGHHTHSSGEEADRRLVDTLFIADAGLKKYKL